MNDYIILGFAIGLVAVLFLIRVAFRKDKTYDYRNYQNKSQLITDENIKIKVRELLSKEKKLQAIKFVRESCEISLIDAKDFVESMENNEYANEVFNTVNTNSFDGDAIMKEINFLLCKGNKIQAIKFVVENKKMKLKEAKDFVELIEEKLNLNKRS